MYVHYKFQFCAQNNRDLHFQMRKTATVTVASSRTACVAGPASRTWPEAGSSPPRSSSSPSTTAWTTSTRTSTRTSSTPAGSIPTGAPSWAPSTSHTSGQTTLRSRISTPMDTKLPHTQYRKSLQVILSFFFKMRFPAAPCGRLFLALLTWYHNIPLKPKNWPANGGVHC